MGSPCSTLTLGLTLMLLPTLYASSWLGGSSILLILDLIPCLTLQSSTPTYSQSSASRI